MHTGGISSLKRCSGTEQTAQCWSPHPWKCSEHEGMWHFQMWFVDMVGFSQRLAWMVSEGFSKLTDSVDGEQRRSGSGGSGLQHHPPCPSKPLIPQGHTGRAPGLKHPPVPPCSIPPPLSPQNLLSHGWCSLSCPSPCVTAAGSPCHGHVPHSQDITVALTRATAQPVVAFLSPQL